MSRAILSANKEDTQEGGMISNSENCAEQHQQSYCKHQLLCTADNLEESQIQLSEYKANDMKECK